MKKYLFTAALLSAVLTGAHAQNYIGENVYLGGTVYDASTTNGTRLATGSSLIIGTGGIWIANDAKITTPRVSTSQTEIVKFTGGYASYTTGYINGYAMVENVLSGFDLPIGQSSFMPLTIDMYIPTGSGITAAWYDAKPLNSTFIIEAGGGAGAQFDFLPGYYDINAAASGFYARPSTPTGAVTATHILGTTNGTNFTDLGLTSNYVPIPTGVSQLRFANKGIILPLTITSFSASKQGNTSGLLTWKVSTEQNIATYSVERSKDGRSFSAIGSVASLGNTSKERTYTFTDGQPLSGSNYYRLKIVEKDGEVSYTAIRILNWSNVITVAVYPNPVKNNATVTGLESNMLVTLVNQQGQVIERLKAQGNTVQIPMTLLSAGTYHIQVADKNGVLLTDQKIVKQ